MHTALFDPIRQRLPHMDSELLQAHTLSAFGFHTACRLQYRWPDRMSNRLKWLDDLLARRFATTLLLVGIPALAIATLI
jgi:hypothetical protein